MSGEALQLMRKVRMLCMNTDDPIYTVSKSHFSMQKLFLQASSRCNVRECRPACHSFFFLPSLLRNWAIILDYLPCSTVVFVYGYTSQSVVYMYFFLLFTRQKEFILGRDG